MLIPVETTILLKENIIKLSAQGSPGILVLPNQHPRISGPHPCAETFLKCTILFVINQLRFFTKIVDTNSFTILIYVIVVGNVFMVGPCWVLSSFNRNYKVLFNHYFAHRFHTVSYTHLRAHETDSYLVCRLLLEK